MIPRQHDALRAAPLAIALASGLLCASAGAGEAQSWDDVSQVISVAPVAGWRAEPGRHVAGLRISLEPGWKTYWRSAGSAGIAPRMDWGTSENVEAVTPAWPTPGLFWQDGDLSIGYDDDFILPLIVATGEGAARLGGRLDLGVCAAVCLPVQVEVEVALPPGGAEDEALIAALADRPRRLPLQADCTTRPTPDGIALTGAVDLPSLGGTETVVFEPADPALWVTDSVVSRQGERITGSSELMAGGGNPVTLDRSRIRITVIGAHGAVELAGCAP
ncbi:protein-disulfide reductase DsbD domain-containing protein [Jannaschia formosa]|uniref:protein-disulfide reductase DsbD domain-containing protein n=1 Tax=Jannaschia formosa TaxID=2259592 RepID=UPI000E1C19B6|nr:protein-disulfide reductase DsbD domain-containing protein [Jannaschia formosa]TFL17341.1 hypothetical protein DR046_15215 [Jannaschia formosa]